MAKKRLNKNVVALIAVVGFGSMIALAVVMLNSLQQGDPRKLVERADQARTDQNWEQARIYYGKAYELSREPVYLVRIGEMFLNAGDVHRALGAWGQALQQKPDLIEAHQKRIELLVEYAKLYGRLQDWQDLHQGADALLKLDADKVQSAFARRANGLALINLAHQDPGNVERGLEELKRATTLAPDNVTFGIDLAVALIRNGKAPEGEQLLKDLAAKNTSMGADASKVQLTNAQFQASRRQFDGARTFFEQAVKLAGDDKTALSEAKTSFAGFLTQQWARLVREGADAKAAFEAAEKMLRQAIEVAPDSSDSYLQLATLYQAAEKPAEALEVCKQRLAKPFPRTGVDGARNTLSNFMLNIRASECAVALGAAAAEKEGPEARDKWLATAQQYVDDAKGEVSSHPKVKTQTARIRIAQGNYRVALSELRAADELYRTYGWIDWENKKLLARMHLQLNEAGAAKELLDEVLEAAQTSQADDVGFWTLYGQVLYRNNELDRALALADRVLLIDANQAEARQLKAAVLDRKGQSEQAGALTSSTNRVLSEARELLLGGNVDRAIEALKNGIEQNPKDVQLAGTLARVLLETGRADDARKTLDEALTHHAEEPTLRKLQVLTRTDLSEAERDKTMLELIDAESDAYKRALEKVAFHASKQRIAESVAAMNEAEKHLIARDTPLAQVNPLSQLRALLMSKLRAGAELKDDRVMAEARDSAMKYDVDGSGGKSVLGAYHMARDEMELATKALREAVNAQPTDSRSLTLLAQCLQSANLSDDARGFYERAVRVNPDEGLAHRGMAMLAKSRNDTPAYEQHLARAEKLAASDSWVQSEVLQRTEQADPQNAIARRERLREQKPDDLQNLLRLAALYETTKQIDKADACYDRVWSLKPDDRELAAGLGRYYRRTDRPEKSLAVAKSYVDSRSGPDAKADAMILVASHWLGVNDLTECEKSLLEAAKLAETLEVTQSLAEFYFRPANRPKEALSWFDKAIKLADQKSAATLQGLRAARASCLLHRAVNGLDAAKVAVEEYRRAYPEDARGLILQSEYHARAGGVDRAIESLSAYLAQSPNDATILFQRAQHFIAQGKMSLATADLEQIKRVNPLAMQLEPRIQLARLYMRAGRRDVGVRELEKLVEESGNAVRAVEELAEFYIRENRLSDADRLVTAQLNRAGVAPDSRWFFLRGRISLALNDADKALNDYLRGAELTKHAPESIALVLEAYSRAERFAEGLSYHDGHASTESRTWRVLSRYAQLLARADQKPKAVEQFRAAMELARVESDSAVRDVTGQLLIGFPQPTEAIGLFRDAPVATGMARANDRIVARLHRVASQVDEAATILRKLLDTAPSDGERGALFYELGEMYQMAKQPTKAREAYDESLRYAPRNWIALNNLAYLLADDLDDFAAAEPFAKQAVAMADNPSTMSELHSALDTLGWIYVGKKDYTNAISELSRALRLRPDEGLTYYHLGEAYRRNQQFEQAGEILEQARRLATDAQDGELVASIDAAIQKNGRRDAVP